METPARAAERLCFGLGIALLLATAFSLIDGRLPPADCPEADDISPGDEPCTSASKSGWLVPGGAAGALLLGLLMRSSRKQGSGSVMGGLLSNEGESEIASRLAEEHVDADDEDRLSGAWADLEVKMLESTQSEEE